MRIEVLPFASVIFRFIVVNLPDVRPTMTRSSSQAGVLVGIVPRLNFQIGLPVFRSSA